MKRFFRTACVFVLALTLALSSACAEIRLTDQTGREITLDAPAQKIVSCYYISTASLLALGLEDRIVGIEMKGDTRGLYRLAAPDIIALPAVGSGKGVNVEEIAALDPDIAILPKRLKDDAALLEALDIPVLLVNPETQEDFEACLTLLGAAAGVEAKAEALLSRYHDMTESVRALTAAADRPSVYMASASDFLTTFPEGLYQNDLIDIAGGRNVAAELGGEAKAVIDAEQLSVWDPDYIFIVAGADYTVEDIKADERFAALKAVAGGSVYTFPSDIESWDYPTPSSVLGQLYMAYVLHPDLIGGGAFMDAATAFYKEVFGIEITKGDLGL